MFSMTPSATAITVLFQVVLTSRVGFVSVHPSIHTSVPLHCVLFDSTLTNSHHHWSCQSHQVRRHHHTTHRHHSHFHQSFNLSFSYSQSKPPSETGTHQSTGDGHSSLEFELFICCCRCDDDCFWPFVFLRFLFRFFSQTNLHPLCYSSCEFHSSYKQKSYSNILRLVMKSVLRRIGPHTCRWNSKATRELLKSGGE